MVAEVELAPDAALEPAQGTGLDGVPGVPFLDSVLLLDVGASFLEEAVRRGQGQREDGGRELVHACLCLRRRLLIARSGGGAVQVCS